MRRRDLLAGLGAVVIGSGTVRANHSPDGEYARAQPDHVSIDEPIGTLEQYRPALDFGDTDRSRFQALRAWRARSPEYEYDWYVYWGEWTHQSGVSDWDSHLGDREPFYVAVDENGDIARIDYSPYHWLHGQVVGASVPTDDAGHPTARVNAPYHHYEVGAAREDATVLPDVTPLSERLQPWLDNGLEEDLRVGSVHDPASMQFASSWWREDIGGQITELRIELNRMLGLRDGEGLL